jgi:phage tail-like protein
MAIRDPYRNFKFRVVIDGADMGFRTISGLKEMTEIIEYREGGENETPRKLPGQTTFENVTLERGIAADGSDLLAWRKQIYDLDSAGGIASAASSFGTDGATNADFRREVQIFLRNKQGVDVWQWDIINAWPSELEVADLDASSNEVLIEKLVLANEGIRSTKLVSAGPLGP